MHAARTRQEATSLERMGKRLSLARRVVLTAGGNNRAALGARRNQDGHLGFRT